MDKLSGASLRGMIDYGARNLVKNCDTINQLNVFPVPDGDTGTNMATTLVKGIQTVDDHLTDLSSVAQKIAASVIFGARGNSGVIVSQFIKGLCEVFVGAQEADGALLVKALENGVVCAYDAVATPVEGTMLTVVREAAQEVKALLQPEHTIDDVIGMYIRFAKESLERTPQLLPALQEAGVVDSGGAGIVCLFEGMQKYLNGETLDAFEVTPENETADYSAFNPNSTFQFGYCTELLIQLLNRCESFELSSFKKALLGMGDSVVALQENDKVRIHIHTHTPEEVFAFCHRYGEFLHLKVENMTVQHTETVKKILCSPTPSKGEFSVVAVAHDHKVQQLFVDMGADVVICCEESASPQEFLDAFENVTTPQILVFPNSSDSMLSAMQAKKLCEKATVIVVPSRGITECYASLPIIDFAETDTKKVAEQIAKTISNLYVVNISRRKDAVKPGSHFREEYYAFSRKDMLAIGRTLEETAVQVIDMAVQKYCKDIITIFHGPSVRPEQLEAIQENLEELGILAEVFVVSMDNSSSEMILSFE